METKKKKSLASRIPGKVWLVISIVALLVVWYILSIIPQTARGFPNLVLTVQGLLKMIERGVFWQDISSSLISVFGGYALGFIIALPVAILMAWYIPVRNILNPWIQFIRNIPPLAYVPLIVIVAGVGRRPQIIVITIACFLTMCVTIYQGVVNVDETLIKAARVFDATDAQLFFNVIVPASVPFILTGVRLGLATALTTLVAAELTGAATGLGTMIQQAGMYFQMDVVLLGIIIIGIIGFIFDKIVLLLEKKLTSWQEVR